MPPTPTDDGPDDPIEQLKSLGLSTYAARTFLALVSLGRGTAQDVSEVSEVPRTRVYDAVEELRGRGLADVRQSSPKQFWPVSTETARRLFDREHERRMDVVTGALERRQSAGGVEEQRGVWTVTGSDAVTDRVVEFVEAAEAEVVYMSVADLLDDGVTDALRAAGERGVTVRLAGISESVENGLRGAIPEAETFESLWSWSETPAGRLLMVDSDRTLVSVLESGRRGAAAGREETAIWGSGASNGLVVVLRTMFTWQLDPDERS
jgi:sugar-specific transcriptional regulator TrmB